MSSLQKFHRRTQPFAVNTLHTGTVSIAGTASVGSVLSVTSTITDVDGLGTFSYQWKRSGSAISGGTSSTYTLVVADVGNTITATITYTDGKGFIESETSAATASVTGPFTILGSGNNTVGYWLGDASSNKLIVAPLSTETPLAWGSPATSRGTVSTTNGLANTNTLAGFGQAAHPAAYYCKTLTTGGYTTWYMPAKAELMTMYSNKSATPFATANSFSGSYYVSSTELDGIYIWSQVFSTGRQDSTNDKNRLFNTRAIRRSAI